MRFLKTMVVSFVILIPLLAQAAPMSFHDEKACTITVTTERGGGANFWVKLYFPDFVGSFDHRYDPFYSSGVFEYDDFIDSVSELKITLDGRDEDGNKPIDIFIDFDIDHHHLSDYAMIASFTQTDLTRSGDANPFKLVMDILTGRLILSTNYGGNPVTTDVGSLTNVDKYDFVGKDYFWIGYGCHFDHLKTEVDVTVNPIPTPEPATMLLLGLGLIGLAGVRGKFKN